MRTRILRLLTLVVAALAAGLLTDALRTERVFFPRTALPAIRTLRAP